MNFLTLAFSSRSPERLAPSMARVHARLIREQGLNVQHFDMVAGHLGDALAELDAALHELAEPQVRPYSVSLVSNVFWRGLHAAMQDLAEPTCGPCSSSLARFLVFR